MGGGRGGEAVDAFGDGGVSKCGCEEGNVGFLVGRDLDEISVEWVWEAGSDEIGLDESVSLRMII